MNLIVAVLTAILLLAIPAQGEAATTPTPVMGTFAVYVGYDKDTDGDGIMDPVGSGALVSIFRDDELYSRVYTDNRSIAIAQLEEAKAYEVFIHCGFSDNGKEVLREYLYMQFWPIGVIELECEAEPAYQTHIPHLFSN